MTGKRGRQPQPKRIKKSLEQRLADLDYHCDLLAHASWRFPQDPNQFRLIAGQLRLLVTKPGTPLLLSLMDELDVVYDVTIDADRPTPIQLVSDGERWRELNRRSVPLAVYVRDALAMILRAEVYTWNRLIRDVAQQAGTAHEDPTIDRELVVEGQMITIGGIPLIFHHLRALAEHRVLPAAALVMQKGMETSGFKPKYFSRPNDG